MNRKYSPELVKKIRRLRSKGKTYSEIILELRMKIPKSSLSEIVKDVLLPVSYQRRIDDLNITNLNRGRKVALVINKIKRENFFEELKKINLPVAKRITEKNTAKIALAMICLGEASKYKPKTKAPFCLGNSDPRVIILFLNLLKGCFKFNIEKVRATVQCRSDQNTKELKKYWINTTGIPERLFYKPLIDPRTKGKPTKKLNYKGVLRIDYFDRKVQLELESLADLVYNEVK